LEGGPPSFPQGFTCPVVLRVCARSPIHFVYGAFTLYDGPSQVPSTRDRFFNSFGSDEATQGAPYNPGTT